MNRSTCSWLMALQLACTGGSTGGTGGGGGGGGTGGTDTGFRAMKDGLPFENYTNDGVTNMTAVEMKRMFGDQVCGAMTGGTCTLTPQAQQYMDEVNKAMNGGHCFGFSHLALLFHRGTLKPSDFGGASVADLKKDNEKLQREIAYWMAMQFPNPAKTAFVEKLAPNALITKLKETFAAGTTGELYTLAFFKTEMGKQSGGHAVTPYAVEEMGDTAKILLYDNNFPKAERALEIDTKANSWKYTATTNPTEPAGLYTGDAMTASLLLAPVSAAQQVQTCSFCGNAVPASMSPQQVVPNGDGKVTVTDEMNRKIDDTTNQIPGASTTPVASADLFGKHQPLFSLPGGSDLTITLDGTGLAAMTEESLTVLGKGYTLAVEGAQLAPGKTDVVKVAKTGDRIVYTTASMQTPTLVLGVEAAGADFEFDIKVAGDTDGQEATLQLDQASGKLKVKVADNDGSTWAVTVRRISDQGVEEFTHAGVTNGGPDTIVLDYGAWAGQGTGMNAGVDLGSDGSIDSSMMLPDEG